MLRLNNISFSIAGRSLFDGASATIPQGHKVGVVGRNGVGKTTLFQLILEEFSLEGGEIERPARARVGTVRQEAASSTLSILETVVNADEERLALMQEAETATDPDRISEIQMRLADIDAWSAEARAAGILRGLGFDADAQDRPVSSFSGGWRMRVALAAALFTQPDVLLLDEPTNYLDLEGAIWLERYIARYPHTVILISHDRGILNRAVGYILYVHDKKLELYTGGYDQFAKQRMVKFMQAGQAAAKQAARVAHLQSFVDRFRAKASKAKQAQSRLKMIEKMDLITPPQEAAEVVFTFAQPTTLSPPIVSLDNASTGYDGRAVISNISLRIDESDRIALLGRNGQGKSTLSKLLAQRLELMDGSRVAASALKIGFFGQHQTEELRLDETPLDHVARLRPGNTPSRNRAYLAQFGLMAAQAETAVAQLSGGQKTRLSLLLATAEAPHLLILDEPTNHLDIESREALSLALNSYNGAVAIVSHDFEFLKTVADRLWLVADGGVREYEGDLDSYRKLALTDETASSKPAAAPKPPKVKPKDKPKSRLPLSKLQDMVAKCEERVTVIEKMRDKLSARLADRDLYEAPRAGELAVLQGKFTEIEEGLAKAETMWMKAIDDYEAAKLDR
jgi:ATP-binding cassette subfamily F protein 3